MVTFVKLRWNFHEKKIKLHKNKLVKVIHIELKVKNITIVDSLIVGKEMRVYSKMVFLKIKIASTNLIKGLFSLFLTVYFIDEG